MPILIALIPALVGLAEKLIPKGSPDAGPRKKRLVTDLVLGALDTLAAHGVVPDWAAGDAADIAISEAIEFAVSQLEKPAANG